jgi:hypothetical protein
MYDEGLVSLTQFQQRSASYQNTIAKKTSAENKVAQTRQEILNTQIEQNAAIQEYTEKISKIEGDRYQALGQMKEILEKLPNFKIRLPIIKCEKACTTLLLRKTASYPD